ncbi:MAG: SDR family NAD(P)-dependent oxidoreductase [Pseudomonadota bacterium]
MSVSDANWTVITGSTGGIGHEIVQIHAGRGASLILVNRSQAKATAQRDEILSKHPDLRIELVMADLLDVAQITGAVDKINAIPGRIDLLYNNAGILTGEKVLSAQGYESQFAVNVLASYLFTKNLRNKMARSLDETAAMIVDFSSSAITPLKSLNLDDLAHPEKVGGLMTTYAQTKLAVTTLAPALAEELRPDNILIRAIDPGATKSAMTTGGNSAMPKVLSWLAPLLFRPADKQAAKLVESADPTAFEGRSGIYVANRKEKRPPAPVTDQKTQRELIAMLDRLSSAQEDR